MSTLGQRMAMDPAGIVWDEHASTRFAAAKPKSTSRNATAPAAPAGRKKPNATSSAASTAAGTAANDKPKARKPKKRAADIFKAANRAATNK